MSPDTLFCKESSLPTLTHAKIIPHWFLCEVKLWEILHHVCFTFLLRKTKQNNPPFLNQCYVLPFLDSSLCF